MEYRYLGNTGLRLSVLSLGAWVTWGSQIDEEVAFQTMKTAFDLGCNFFDNAEVYANGKAEEVMGRCIKRLGVDRSELVISTKIFWGGSGVNQRGLSRKHIIEGMNASLQRLQLDYVDLVFCHRPDHKTPIEETVRAMNWLIEKGKAFYWGTSEWPKDMIIKAKMISDKLGLIGPVMEQPQYNMLHRYRVEREYESLYNNDIYHIGLTVWSPLASGLLTGKYKSIDKFEDGTRLGLNNAHKWLREELISGKGINGLDEKDINLIINKVIKLKSISDSIGCSIPQLALAWTIKNPNVTTAITGASKVDQVIENFKSLEVLPKLTDDIMNSIEDILQNKPAPTKEFR